MSRGHLVEIQQRRQLLRIDAVVLAFAAEDQPQPTRMGHDNTRCVLELGDRIVQRPVSARCLEHNAEALVQRAEEVDGLRPRAPDLAGVDLSAVIIEND